MLQERQIGGTGLLIVQSSDTNRDINEQARCSVQAGQVAPGHVALTEKVDFTPVPSQKITLKRFYQEGSQVRLQPANPTMGPMFFPARNVEVMGKVICVIRQLN